ncbi:MAG: hypothetical protein JWO82_3679 [Akkermansiaceae bacterium]|nr:hypothetical protein [Akkermansiaceae bacterium]
MATPLLSFRPSFSRGNSLAVLAIASLALAGCKEEPVKVTVDYDSPGEKVTSSSPGMDQLVALRTAELELDRETATAEKLRAQLRSNDSLDDLEWKKRALQIGIESKKATLRKIEMEIKGDEK